jgi:hypothetical protein
MVLPSRVMCRAVTLQTREVLGCRTSVRPAGQRRRGVHMRVRGMLHCRQRMQYYPLSWWMHAEALSERSAMVLDL